MDVAMERGVYSEGKRKVKVKRSLYRHEQAQRVPVG
jgi:hypothetical protein